jgi:hypothetical protein
MEVANDQLQKISYLSLLWLEEKKVKKREKDVRISNRL